MYTGLVASVLTSGLTFAEGDNAAVAKKHTVFATLDYAVGSYGNVADEFTKEIKESDSYKSETNYGSSGLGFGYLYSLKDNVRVGGKFSYSTGVTIFEGTGSEVDDYDGSTDTYKYKLEADSSMSFQALGEFDFVKNEKSSWFLYAGLGYQSTDLSLLDTNVKLDSINAVNYALGVGYNYTAQSGLGFLVKFGYEGSPSQDIKVKYTDRNGDDREANLVAYYNGEEHKLNYGTNLFTTNVGLTYKF